MQIGKIPGVGGGRQFDNSYFRKLLALQDPATGAFKRGGLPSDIVLATSAETRPIVQEYAADNARFLRDFHDAYFKLTSLGYSSA